MLADLKGVNVPQNVIDAIVKVANDNVKVPSVDISGYVDIVCPAGNGLDIIKKGLKSASTVDGGEGTLIEITYVGAPRYRIRVIAPDYKKAENVLKKSADEAIGHVVKHGGEGEFHRHMEEAKSFQ